MNFNIIINNYPIILIDTSHFEETKSIFINFTVIFMYALSMVVRSLLLYANLVLN